MIWPQALMAMPQPEDQTLATVGGKCRSPQEAFNKLVFAPAKGMPVPDWLL
jgi:hypothetical protein